MTSIPVGSLWLKNKFNITGVSLTHCSYIGNNDSIEISNKGNIDQVYSRKYSPVEDTPLSHLEFSLKYDDLSLAFLRKIFDYIPIQDIERFIASSPAGKYSRKIGFFFEMLTGNKLAIKSSIGGNYVDLLENEKYVTGTVIKNTRWRVNDNLLGTDLYCPIVRKTNKLKELLKDDIRARLEQLKTDFSPAVFNRAINYLYNKETRSSYEIEKEQPTPDRMEKFVALLTQAGAEESELLLDEKRLTHLQNAIVDNRFWAQGYRDFQNYIGQTLPDYMDMIHYICPPPVFVRSMMKGLVNVANKTSKVPAEVRAAIISFGFVFIHPFEDGNGRIHRFLIHDILVHDKVVPKGLIIPVSAHMLSNMRDYDAGLERYSKPIMQVIKYAKNRDGELEVLNKEEVEAFYRFPDLTEQCIYLTETIHATLKEDMPEELLFIERYDEVKRALQDIVDMPDRHINLMVLFLHQNKGVFPKRRREQFSKLTDGEIGKMETEYRRIFELDKL
ncbi:Fic family protein [Chitinophaga sp. sic0106]|uniref:Fic family protein n=1 Tax=Chitinophaga sp. sic0106 TaxID=2854785 RepID=UPI001C460C55|nr:Fic family protein [Chitinophaga sp. sic0106]MBV7533252.1 Fic family protein [Chitinophaga sp. sic0106]